VPGRIERLVTGPMSSCSPALRRLGLLGQRNRQVHRAPRSRCRRPQIIQRRRPRLRRRYRAGEPRRQFFLPRDARRMPAACEERRCSAAEEAT
jgi:hypothetical protein